jgi:hypothetical protein
VSTPYFEHSADQLAALLRFMPEFNQALDGEAAYKAFVAYPVDKLPAQDLAIYKNYARMDWRTFTTVLAAVKLREFRESMKKEQR